VPNSVTDRTALVAAALVAAALVALVSVWLGFGDARWMPEGWSTMARVRAAQSGVTVGAPLLDEVAKIDDVEHVVCEYVPLAPDYAHRRDHLLLFRSTGGGYGGAVRISTREVGSREVVTSSSVVEPPYFGVFGSCLERYGLGPA
jgi:hypothetical protein